MSVPGITTAVDPVRTAGGRNSFPAQPAQQGGSTGGAPVPAGGNSLPPAPVPTSLDAVHAAAAAIEQHLRESGRQLLFRVDEVTGQMVVTVTNPETGEVVRQLPSEELLRIARDLAHSKRALVNEFA